MSDKRERERLLPLVLLNRLVFPCRNDTSEALNLSSALAAQLEHEPQQKALRQTESVGMDLLIQCEGRSLGAMFHAYNQLANKLIDTGYELDPRLEPLVERVFESIMEEDRNAAALEGTAKSGAKLGLRWYEELRRQGMYKPRSEA